jgi:hypothetical protein
VTSGDTFVLDQHYIQGVNSGFTLEEIANAVAYYRIDPSIAQDGEHRRLAWFLWIQRAVIADIDSIAGSVLTLSGTRFDSTANYVGHTVQFHLSGTNTYRFARITAQSGADVTVDTLPADVDDTWHLYVLPERPITSAQATADTAGTATLLSRVVGTLAAGTHTAQSGDGYSYLTTNLGALGVNATALAPAATALSNVVWTNAKAGYLDAAISTRQALVANLANTVTMAASFAAMAPMNVYTAEALANAPGGGGGDATEAKQNIIIAALAVVDGIVDAVLEDTGTTLPAQIASLDVGSGTGPYVCTWTVTDGTSDLQNAIVSFWLNGVLKGHGTTDSDGEVSMSLGSETGTVTYDVAISCDGYVFAGTTHAVGSTVGTWTETFAMTALVSTPSVEPDSVTVRWRVKKGNRQWAGVGEATVYIQIVDGPGTDGIIWHGDNEDFDSDATDANGYVEFTNIPVPCTFRILQ